ncbi:MAG: recombinase family protein, partial [Subdoligranulum sp.]
ASLLTIKKKLEAGGVLTARGNKSGRPRAYSGFSKMRNTVAMCSLQKTFIEDVLTGVSKKNTGQLPQYYIGKQP